MRLKKSNLTVSCTRPEARVASPTSQAKAAKEVRAVASRIRRLIRRPMTIEEYIWIGEVLTTLRAEDGATYLKLVKDAGLDAGKILACEQAYAKKRSANASSCNAGEGCG